MRTLAALSLALLSACDNLAYTFPGTRWGCGGRFDCTDQSAKDLETGLTWQRDIESFTKSTIAAATTRCANLRNDGASNWRLPTIAELETLDDPAWPGHFDADAFPASGEAVFVSSDVTDTAVKIYVYPPQRADHELVSVPGPCSGFTVGDHGAFERPKSCGYLVRCVRKDAP